MMWVSVVTVMMSMAWLLVGLLGCGSSLTAAMTLQTGPRSPRTSTGESNVVVIFAKPTFHEEVVGAAVCALYNLGFYTVVYIGNGVLVGGFMVPLTGLRERKSTALYGRCVSKFETIQDSMELHVDAKFIVFISPPAAVSKTGITFDSDANQLLEAVYPGYMGQYSGSAAKYIAEKEASLRHKLPNVAIIWHNAEVDIVTSTTITGLQKYIPAEKLTYLFLGSHVHDTSKQQLQSVQANNTDMVLPRYRYFYPVYPLSVKGPKAILDKLSHEYELQLLSKYILLHSSVESFNESLPLPTAKDSLFVEGKVKPSTVFSMQGNFGGRHSHRRDPSHVLSCIRDSVHNAMLHSHVQFPSSSKENCPFSLELVGRFQNPVEKIIRLAQYSLSDSRSPGAVVKDPACTLRATGLHNAPYGEFYNAIANSDFLVGGVNSDSYYTAKATSSLPTALINGVPFIASKRLVSIYPCIGNPNSAHNRLLARETECDSIRAASLLTKDEYAELKAETGKCAKELWDHANDVFKGML
jgi:hypothetical protein